MAPPKETILIVDTDKVTRDLLTRNAESLGLSAKSCAEAESAWNFFVAESPRLIVLDWDLPAASGIRLCQKLRSSRLGKYLTILVLTANDRPEEMEKGLEAGANSYMVKPLKEKFYRAWVSFAKKQAADLRELEKSDTEIKSIKNELEEVNEQLEASISRANQLTMESEKAYIEVNQVFKTVAGGILVIDTDYNIIKHNDNFLAMLEEDIGSAVNKKCHDIFPSALCGTPDCPINRLSAPGAEGYVESRICRELSGRKKVHYSTISTPLRGLVGETIGIVEHITDITLRVAAEEALRESEKRYRQLSTVDELTGLFNKRYFNTTLQAELRRSARYDQQPLALIMMDIDNFKLHNDTYGHAEGDKVLEVLGQIIRDSLRQTDVGCRYGGEEFVVILPATDGEGALVVAERIRATFAAAAFCDGTVHKTISLGVTQYMDGDDRELIITRADGNLYYAKEHGKNRSVLEPGK
ncbi:MAG: diguanylate cyclase [Deltaproteobacteria bacterium]|nr:diguanylate cyclase [Deltaproteobacteria bacterium]